MKRTFFLIALSLFCFAGFAQKFGFTDSEYILSKMPAYKEANETMNKYSDQWVKDIKIKYDELEKMKIDFQQEEILLTEEMKQKRIAEITKKENEVKNLNNEVFGLNGQLFLKKKEIMKPLMDEFYNAAEKVARQKKLAIIFDKASDISMIYTDPRHDYTDYIMEELGLVEK
jgi:outer membrane protein